MSFIDVVTSFEQITTREETRIVSLTSSFSFRSLADIVGSLLVFKQVAIRNPFSFSFAVSLNPHPQLDPLHSPHLFSATSNVLDSSCRLEAHV